MLGCARTCVTLLFFEMVFVIVIIGPLADGIRGIIVDFEQFLVQVLRNGHTLPGKVHTSDNVRIRSVWINHEPISGSKRNSSTFSDKPAEEDKSSLLREWPVVSLIRR